MERVLHVAILLAIAVASAWLIRRQPVLWAASLIAWLSAQQLLGPLLWGVTRNVPWTVEFILLKEVAIVGAAVGVLPTLLARRHGLHPSVYLAFGYAAIILIYVPGVLAAQPIDQTLRGIRELAVPVSLFVIGYGMVHERADLSRMVGALLGIGIAVAAVAVVERLLVPDSFWLSIDLRGYWVSAKGLSPNTISPAGLPGNFYAYFAGPGVDIRRAVGSLGDPLGLSYFLVPPYLLSVAGSLLADSKRRWLFATTGIASAVAMALSLSRLPLLVAGVGSAILLAWAIPRNTWTIAFARRLFIGMLPAAVLAITFGLVVASAQLSGSKANGTGPLDTPGGVGPGGYVDPSFETHLAKLGDVDWAQVLLGGGVGRGGILSSAYISTGTSVSSNEDVFLDIASQIGILGAIAFAGTLLTATITLLRAARRKVPDRWDLAGLGLSALGLFTVGVFSPQLLVVTSMGAFWLVLGAATRSIELPPPIVSS